MRMETQPAFLQSDMDWAPKGTCATVYAETGYDAWYGPNDDDPEYNTGQLRAEDMKRARRYCAECPVRLECLTFAFNTNQQYGIWGGYTPTERTQIRKRALAERAAKELAA